MSPIPKEKIFKSPHVIWSILILSSYAALYRLRSLDQNIYFRWSDLFSNVNLIEIFILFLACFSLAYILSISRIDIDEKHMLLSLFLGSFLLGAVFWSAPEESPGVATYFTEAKYLSTYGILAYIRDWGVELDVLSDFPAVPFIFGLIFTFAGESKIYLQIFTTSMFAATAVLTYLIGGKLWGERTGKYAALFFVSFPYLLLKTSFTLLDVPLMLFLSAAIYATLRALDGDKSKIWILSSVAFIVLVFLTKISAWIMLGTIPAIFLMYYKKKGRTVVIPAVSIALLSGLLILTFVYYKLDVLIGIFKLIMDFQIRLESFYESPWSLLLFHISPLITVMAGFSIYLAVREKDINFLLILAWFIIPFIFLYDTRIRYLVPSLPALAIMASIALNRITSENFKKFGAYGIAISSIMLAVFFYLPHTYTFSSMNIKNAAEYTNPLDIEKIEVYANTPDGHTYDLNMLIPIFDLYSNKDIATPKYTVPKAPPNAIPWWWSYKYPWPYYSKKPDSKNAVVIINPDIQKSVPGMLERRLEEEYTLARVYSAGDKYVRPYVTIVYLPKPEIEVKSPSGGENLIAGTAFNITWDLMSALETHPVFLVNAYSPSTDTYQRINFTTKRWHIWKIDTKTFPPADDYRIRIQGSDDDWQTYYYTDSEMFSVN